MNEKEFETNSNTDAVNSWDTPMGDGKVLAKSFQGQITSEPSSIVQESIPVVEEPVSAPYQTPDLDFTIAMPAIPEPVVEQVSIAPIIEQPVLNPIVTPVVSESAVEQVVVNPVASVAIPVNSEPLPVFDMPEMNINNSSKPDVAPLTDIKDIPIVAVEPTLDSKGPVEISTMSSEELSQHFAGIIEADEDPLQDVIRKPGDTLVMDALPTNGEMVEPFKQVSENTFSNIFSKNDQSEEFVDSKEGLETQPGIPKQNERPELVPPKHNNEYKKVKKRLIPAGWGIGTAVFVILFIYVVFINDIVDFINNFTYSFN